jgi:hypothetical protein
VYRSATLSLTFDEAISYTQFVQPSIQSLFIYSTNNHILSSWLMKATTSLFGSSELALRLPAIAGAALYLWSLLRISESMFERWEERLIVVALLSWNPLLLDFFCLARGYSLALGFLFLALWFLTAALREEADRARPVALASAALALSVASNWSFLFVEIGLGLGFLIACAVRVRSAGGGIRRWLRSATALILPGALTATAVIGPYASRMMREWSFVGFSTTPADSVRDVVNAIFFRSATALRTQADLRSSSDLLAPHTPSHEWVLAIAVPLLVAAVLILLVVLLVFSIPLLTEAGEGRIVDRLVWLIGFSLTINWAAYDAGHYGKGLSFPLDRVFIYVVPLTGLLFSGIAFGLLGGRVRPLFLGLGVVLLVLCAPQLDPRYTRSWTYNAEARSFFRILRDRHTAAPARHFEIGGPWLYSTVFEYYRQRDDNAAWLSSWRTVSEPGAFPFDFFVYHPDDLRPSARQKYRDIAADPVSGARLAERVLPSN